MSRRSNRPPSGREGRLKPIEQDPLAEYGLPSKGEKRLLSHRVQESYYALIVSRYLAFCTDAGDSDTLQQQFARHVMAATTAAATSSHPPPPPPKHHTRSEPGSAPNKRAGSATDASTSTNPRTKSNTESDPKVTAELDTILSALRKLREGIIASRRRDHFATQVFLFSARAGILAGAYETYHPSLAYLMRRHVEEQDQRRRQLLQGREQQEEERRQRQQEQQELYQQRQRQRQQRRQEQQEQEQRQEAEEQETEPNHLRRSRSWSGSSSTRFTTAKPTDPSPTTTTSTPDPTNPPSPSSNDTTTTNPIPSADDSDLTPLELTEILTYLILDASCRQSNLLQAYSLLHQHRRHLRAPDLHLTSSTLRALATDNWVAFRRLLARHADGYQARLMALADKRVTAHVLKAVGRAYLILPSGVVEEWTGRRWGELVGEFGVGWELGGDGRVTIRKIGGRTA
ncbi:hypothetical protein VTJ49DRAFT_1972 [Mycothermus thermophilus]|uniref:CSN8/PSMD8/EIF3K domain-containing protein n=1 Tax=Humicola insolens TaxID=85995 RepID=A0ABR3VPL1_HUMIN